MKLRLFIGVSLLGVMLIAFLMLSFPNNDNVAALEQARELPASPKTEDDLQLIWLGVAGVYLGDGDTGVLIDPFVSRYSMGHIILDREIHSRAKDRDKLYGLLADLPIDLVIVSHSHYDHALDAPFVANHFNVPLVGSQSTAAIGKKFGVQKIVIAEDGTKLKIGRFSIDMRYSEHGDNPLSYYGYPGVIGEESALKVPSDFKLGKVYAIHLHHENGLRIVHQASAAFLPHTYQGLRADIAILGVALRESTELLIKRVVGDLGVKTIIPIHFDNFFTQDQRELPFVALREFVTTTENQFSGVKVRFAPYQRKVFLGY